jgi:hypothetical protein
MWHIVPYLTEVAARLCIAKGIQALRTLDLRLTQARQWSMLQWFEVIPAQGTDFRRLSMHKARSYMIRQQYKTLIYFAQVQDNFPCAQLLSGSLRAFCC